LEFHLPILTIQGTPIDFPDDGNSPDWAGTVIQFAQAVTLALSGLTSPGDLGKNYFPLTSAQNPVTNLAITGFVFDPTSLRSVYARYYVFRTTDMVTVAEAGTFTMVYNPTNPTGSMWETSQSFVGNAQVTFTVTDAGQVEITTETLAGSNHSGTVGFVAQVLSQ
jgi:hypothetical protein